ncbi:MAG: hypothetical protein DI551_05640 [Micavibrio aeruginosavorus]|uniref:Uncharacterized protein n=1 Tax=Micavibrio aeruginosavorus TaxID=349221 RepID=A0A2W5MXY2_9BACT|nr:MAG: hypothetical protein DI551_05640 [Micavibrio aeruginosavorus]
MKEKLIMFGLMCAFTGAIFLAGYFKGQGSCQAKQSNAVVKELKHEAKAIAGRPRNRDDIVDSLCRAGRDKLKREGGPVEQIPLLCR